MKIRIIGDVHGKYGEYLNITDGAEYSIQVGDMGFNYDHMKGLDPLHHTFFGGNHDNYDIIKDVSHCHGNYGMRHLGNGAVGPVFEYFFIRGAYSVDKKYRTPGLSWWEEEELSYKTADRCLQNYNRLVNHYNRPPELVLSHDCPSSLYHSF